MWILALDECKRYGIINSYLELLYDIHTKLSLEELYDATLAIKQFNERNELGSMESYYLEEIFKVLQEAFIIDDEKCVELAYLEWMLRNVFEWEQMKCLQLSLIHILRVTLQILIFLIILLKSRNQHL